MARRGGTGRRKGRGAQVEGELPFGNNWGGRREGAGRKPKGERAGVSHLSRQALASRFPVHVTMRLRKGLPSLRRRAPYRVLLGAFAKGRERFGFRLVQYSVQTNHLHMLVEAKDRRALSRGLQGLFVRVAKGLNRLWGRRGSVFADRYHDRILRTPWEVRVALGYVLNNAVRHGTAVGYPDPYSSGPWFDGWRRGVKPLVEVVNRSVVARARTWLLSVGWRRHRLIGYLEVPWT